MSVLDTLRYAATWMRSRAVVQDEEGASLVEYGLLLALIAVAVMGTLTILGLRINTLFCSVLTTLGGTCP